MPFLLISMAWRNLWRSSRRTLITLSSIFFAVVLALFTESMGYGQHEQMIRNMVKFSSGYLRIQHLLYEEEPSMDNLIEWSEERERTIKQQLGGQVDLVPRLESFVLAAGPVTTKGIYLVGLSPTKEDKMIHLDEYLIEGEFSDNPESIVLGSEAARKLNVSINDTLVLIGQGYHGASAAAKLFVSGLIEHPLKAMNQTFGYVPLEGAQTIFSAYGLVSGILIMPENAREIDPLADKLKPLLTDHNATILTWKEIQPDLVTAIEFDRASGRVFTGILYMVIGFGIFGTILTMTLEREREFGGLLALGMQRWQLSIVTFWELIFLAILGIASGIGIGFFMLLYLFNNPIPLTGDMAETMRDFGMEPILGFSMNPEIFMVQSAIVFGMCLVIAFYPTFRIHYLDTLDAMKR